MKCKNCKWWNLVEQDEEEREVLQKEIDDFGDLVKGNHTSKEIANMCEAKEILDSGWCRRFPPYIEYREKCVDESNYAWYGIFPKTNPNEWCGEFKAKNIT